eukprot:SM000048S16568  [mRNA]  locus=s48:526308:529491:+ [translate_table: standard]
MAAAAAWCRRASAEAMSRRCGDRFPSASFDLLLENQSGRKLVFESEDDRRALTMGLVLHAKARGLLGKSRFAEALEVLTMAEVSLTQPNGASGEAFALCNKVHVQAVDNVAILQIDIVWCLFQQRDIQQLPKARARLAEARSGLRRSHGADLQRLQHLQGGFRPELATYVRLELLEGVVAYHSGDEAAARSSLLSAQAKLDQLEVSDEALAQLATMGFSLRESRRALRFCGQDMLRAVEFATDQKRRRHKRQMEQQRQDSDRREQRQFERTPDGRAVDLRKLDHLCSLGYARPLAAEALRQGENDNNAALDQLLDVDAHKALQASLAAQVRRRSVKDVDMAAADELIGMGFSRERVLAALQEVDNDRGEALERLLSGTDEERASQAGLNDMERVGEDMERGQQALLEGAADMEGELARDVSSDPLAEYDVDVAAEGTAISEYMALLDSPQASA